MKRCQDGWYTKVAGVRRLYGPNGWLRTARQAWPFSIHQRFEEGMPVVTVDLRPGQMEKARRAVKPDCRRASKPRSPRGRGKK